MNKISLLALLLLGLRLSLTGQYEVRGKVTDEEGAGLPFVNITLNEGRSGTASDIDGNFALRSSTPITQLRFSYLGFKAITLSGKDIRPQMQVQLSEETVQLSEATVMPGENPAHRLIRQVRANRERNDPNNLERFYYETYSKFWVTFNVDSIDPRIDTVWQPLNDSVRAKALRISGDSALVLDSFDYQFRKTFEEQHLFFMETVTQRKKLGNRDNEKVLAQRTSGFKNPLFALLVTQMQSFSFYEDYIGITGDDYLNPISRGSTQRYFFLLEDTLIQSPGDTIYYVSFRPRPNKSFKALQGVLAIHTRDWALDNVRARPASEEALPITVRQKYQRYGPHRWFPSTFEADIELNNVAINQATPKAILRRKLLKVDLDPPLEKKDIDRTEVTIANDASRQADARLKLYRDSLNSREQKTYRVLDSLSAEGNFERNLNILLAVVRGYIPLGPINVDLGKLLRYNNYEGLRLGLGVETNERFSEWLTLGGYYAYGFGDEVHKYGGNFRVDLHKNARWSLSGDYHFDLIETGGWDLPNYEVPSLLEDNYRRYQIEQWDETLRQSLAMGIDLLPNLSYELRWQQERRNTLGTYRFGEENSDLTGSNHFQFSEIRQSLRWAPGEEYAKTPEGKLTLRRSSPVFWLTYSRGIPNGKYGEFAFHQIQTQASYRWQTLFLGELSFDLRGGLNFEDLPAAKNFVGTANLRNADFWDRNLNLADRRSFETMRFNEFLSDRYLELFFRQDLKSMLFRRGDFAPHLELVSRMAIGDLRRPDLHQGVRFQSLEHGFFESGLEINRLSSSNFFGLGIGFYYRYGAYHLPQIEDNITLKLTSKFQL